MRLLIAVLVLVVAGCSLIPAGTYRVCFDIPIRDTVLVDTTASVQFSVVPKDTSGVDPRRR